VALGAEYVISKLVKETHFSARQAEIVTETVHEYLAFLTQEVKVLTSQSHNMLSFTRMLQHLSTTVIKHHVTIPDAPQ